MKARTLLLYAIFFGIMISALTSCQNSSKNKINLEEITIAEIQEGYKTGKFNVVEITQAYLDRISEIDQNGPILN